LSRILPRQSWVDGAVWIAIGGQSIRQFHHLQVIVFPFLHTVMMLLVIRWVAKEFKLVTADVEREKERRKAFLPNGALFI